MDDFDDVRANDVEDLAAFPDDVDACEERPLTEFGMNFIVLYH